MVSEDCGALPLIQPTEKEENPVLKASRKGGSEEAAAESRFYSGFFQQMG